MFDKEFYPTPAEVIKKMLEPFYIPEPEESDEDPAAWRRYRSARENSRLNDMVILEPSAGAGNILDFIKEEFCYRRRDIEFYCIETNPDLQHMLRDKGYKMIGTDFLNYTGDYYIDLIIMNPPFSTGDQHLLKAWEIMKEGNIICLLNAETIRNPFTERRKLIGKIIEDNHGTVEYIGNAFTEAERETDVEVCIIRLNKTQHGTDKLQFDFSNDSKERDFKLSENILHNPIATRDIIGNMILQHERVKEYFVKYLEAIEGLKFYCKPLVEPYFDLNKTLENLPSGDKKKAYNEFNNIMKSQIWKEVMNHLNIEKYMTHKVRQDFSTFCKHQGALDFTKENVSELVTMIFENRYSILDRAVVEVFDIFTSYHKENRMHIEGWKTNDKWKVNRKVILPNWVSYGSYCKANHLKEWGDNISINSSRWSEYSDIDKVMCYITGRSYEDIQSLYDCLKIDFQIIGNVKTGDKFDNTGQSTFFNYKFWKKGTLHIEFKDIKLWEEFNLRACAGKKWLPDAEQKEWERSREQKTETAQEPIQQPGPGVKGKQMQLQLCA